MSKKSLPVRAPDEATWRGRDEDLSEFFTDGPVVKSGRGRVDRSSRQCIEEYFERKRLAEALQEHLSEDFFRT